MDGSAWDWRSELGMRSLRWVLKEFEIRWTDLKLENLGRRKSCGSLREKWESERNSKKKVKYRPEYDDRSTGIKGPVDRKDTESYALGSVDWSNKGSRPVAQKKYKIFLSGRAGRLGLGSGRPVLSEILLPETDPEKKNLNKNSNK